MKSSRVYSHWLNGALPPFHTAVSLHSHTLYSLESLGFIEQVSATVPVLSGAVRKQCERFRAIHGHKLDLSQAWWTPPLSPLQAWHVETKQIEQVLGKNALVSLSDHDNMNACMNLRVLEDTRMCPLSVEWTVPFRQTFFHIGVHNMPALAATQMMEAMNAFTAAPDDRLIAPLLQYLSAAPESLIILNHPVWDENHIGQEQHADCLRQFLEEFSPFLHALELNGLRPVGENQRTIQLAESVGLPVVSGGDRHGREPNACVNLTNATSFAEFAGELRAGEPSNVLFLPQYREPLKMRIFENLFDILEDDPNHALGWNHWSERVFYRRSEGSVHSLHKLWGNRFPSVVNRFVSVIRLANHRSIRSALRMAFNETQEFAL